MILDDDAFLTSISQGQDPSAGDDEVAALFLELREDVERQMPPAPIIEGAGLVAGASFSTVSVEVTVVRG